MLLVFVGFAGAMAAQKATLRGHVFDGDTGEPVAFATVLIAGTNQGTTTDYDGFFSFTSLAAGSYDLEATFIGYDTARTQVELSANGVEYVRLTVREGVRLSTVEVSAGRTQARTEVRVSRISLTPKDIRALPSVGGDADLAQYLPVLPGIVTTGDQGGQIYIRGGAPIQNKVLLDGVTIFNPFHTIGFFSVFETEAIRDIDVLTGGFGAEYGGRLSAVVDITTKAGNRKKFSGLIGVSPFQTRALLEGPIKALDEQGGGSSTSYLVTAKRGYLDQTSRSLYGYVNDSIGLPYSFTDVYGKISQLGANGSKAELFGFRYDDAAQFTDVAYAWTTFGAGTNFKVVPPASNLVMDGSASYSSYEAELRVPEQQPRTSSLTNYLARINFQNFSGRNELRYGFEFNGVRTDFRFRNPFGNTLELRNDNTEIAAYASYRRTWDKFVLEPGVRLQFYASQGVVRPEPRLGAKLNATDWLRFKFAGGLFSQNLLSSVSETDVVNLFVGFISGPEETVFETDGVTPLPDRLQKAVHAIGGVEVDLGQGILVNIEPYWKQFTQLLAVNRDRRTSLESDFVSETGDAYGLDLSLAYDRGPLYLWLTYSYSKVQRDDGQQVYPTVFDRRHNANALASYTFGRTEAWEASVRYNFGTGFPFTATSGFYGREDFEGGLNTDLTAQNPDLGILFSDTRNGNRLPNYHRADASVKRTFALGGDLGLEVVASVTNLSNRENIFYVDRVNNRRVNQLPILPSLGATFRW